MKKLDLRYSMTYEEAKEAFYALATRRSRGSRIAVSVILVAICVSMLAMYAYSKTGIHYLFLAVCSIAMLFYVIYQPALAARRGASKVSKTGGEYHIILNEDGSCELPDGTKLDMGADKYARAIETDNVFAVRFDGEHTVCIPKRILKDKEEVFIREHFDIKS